MSIDGEMDKGDVVHICNGILLSHEKNEIMPFAATRMDLEIMILSEVSQTEEDNTISHYLHVKFLKNDINELIYKTETDSQT